VIWADGEKQYIVGDRVPIWIIQRDIKIKHRASLSRILKGLKKKGLIRTYGKDIYDLGRDSNWIGSGKYAKYVGLTSDGSQVVKILKDITSRQ